MIPHWDCVRSKWGRGNKLWKNKKQPRVINLAETGGGPPNEMELITTPRQVIKDRLLSLTGAHLGIT